jgi:plasmid stability protein
MGQVLIRNLDDAVIQALKMRAAAHGVSLEAELRDMLTRQSRSPRAALIQELAASRAMTPAKRGKLAEELVREGRDGR